METFRDAPEAFIAILLVELAFVVWVIASRRSRSSATATPLPVQPVARKPAAPMAFSHRLTR